MPFKQLSATYKRQGFVLRYSKGMDYKKEHR